MTSTSVLRVGTRASQLARTQTGYVIDALGLALGVNASGVNAEVITITTEGDVSPLALSQIGGTGVFVTALRTALLNGEIDIAVHSLKDLPTAPADGITIAAIPQREDPRDALIARDGLTLGELPNGARIGTGSPRRAAQIRALGLGYEIVPIRGNVDTRIARVADGDLDGVVLALAGLRRLGRDGEVTEILDPLQVLPAPAQGALAIEVRTEDLVTAQLVSTMDHVETRAAVTAERALLAALEAGCSSPVGSLADVVDSGEGLELFLRGSVTAVDGSDAVRLSATGAITKAKELGERLAAELLAEGANTMMGSST
jgi:hydroxymethylbilane synthase